MSECPTCSDEFKNVNGMKVHHVAAHDESISGVEIECHYCGKTAEKRQKKKRNDHEFCSRKCFNNYQSEELSGENSVHWEGKQVTVSCDWCGEETTKKQCNYEDTENSFCSMGCHGKWISEHNQGENNPAFKPENTVECDWCGQSHQKSTMKLERNENHFCSNDCRGEWQSEARRGENHPRWFDETDRVSYGGSWPQKRQERLEKDGHQCVVCGKSNAQEKVDHDRGLSVHHITKAKNYLQNDGSLNEEKAHRLENLITLCTECHNRWEGIPLRPEVDHERT